VTVIRLGEIEPRAQARGHGPTPPEGAFTGISDAHRVHLTWRCGKGRTDDTCALVVFSVNGIDGVGPADRGTVVSGIHRVLRLGGMLASSTHILDDRSAGRRPWDRDWRRAIAEPGRAISSAVRDPPKVRSDRRRGGLNAYGDGWASLVARPYDVGVVWHHITLAASLRAFGEAGFTGTVDVHGESSDITTATGHAAFDRAPSTSESGWRCVHARPPASVRFTARPEPLLVWPRSRLTAHST